MISTKEKKEPPSYSKCEKGVPNTLFSFHFLNVLRRNFTGDTSGKTSDGAPAKHGPTSGEPGGKSGNYTRPKGPNNLIQNGNPINK